MNEDSKLVDAILFALLVLTPYCIAGMIIWLVVIALN